ncbi:CueP family metal-binding protein [Brachybacterium sp. DNPG3]
MPSASPRPAPRPRPAGRPRRPRPARRSLLLLPAAAGLATLLAACADGSDDAPSGSASGTASSSASGTASDGGLLAARGWEDRTAREIIDELEALPLAERPSDLSASVHQTELLLADAAGEQVALPLADDEFYLAIAPYAAATHDCFLHSLTTCTGELRGEDLQVLVTRADGGPSDGGPSDGGTSDGGPSDGGPSDGTTLVDAVLTTAPGGFLGLWLPRDAELIVSIEHDGAVATAEVATGADAPTCLTSMQLEA